MSAPTQTQGSANGAPPAEPSEPTTYLTAAQIQSAPPDCREEDLDMPEWGGTIRIRSATAATAAKIKGAMVVIDASGESVGVDIEAAERVQVQFGIIQPALSEADVAHLQQTMGPSWQKVIMALDRLAGPLGKPGQGGEARFPGEG